MNPERWKQIDALLSLVLECEEGQRAAFLSRACGGDEGLRKEVQALLLDHKAAGSFLQTSVPVAAEMLAAARRVLSTTESEQGGGTRSERTLPSQDKGEVDGVKRGSALGRYIVLNKLGGGGMGIVYAAYDPELDRKVALKLLHAEATEEPKAQQARTRLLREAQAMARLSHANAITVHDVGTLGKEVFIAMEFIDGRTLAKWLKEKDRGTREILEVFVQAGRGLAAAHAAGLVHRDFKPDNVLIGNDGRVKVLDFGLARPAEDLLGDAPTVPRHLDEKDLSTPRLLDTPLTKSGAFLGTPSYMAPEQFLGKTTDARTDQFSFCVALYEALYGERPFEGNSIEVLAQQVTSGKVKNLQPSRRLPGHVRPMLRRGLRPKPDERFPSMEPLLQALSKDPRVFRRRALAAGTAVLAVAIFAAIYRQAAYRHSQLCKGAEEQLSGIWNKDRGRAVEAAFLGTGASFAADAFRETKKSLDKYAQTWVHAQTDACEATRLRGEQSEELLDLRMACLSQRREEFRVLVDLFATADRKLVQNSAQAAQALTSLDGCSNAEALKSPVRPPSDLATRAKVEELEKAVASGVSLLHAGKLDGLPAATAIVDQAKAIHYRPIEGKGLYLVGSLYLAKGDYKRAEQSVREAILASEAGRIDDTRAQALTTMVWLAKSQDNYQQAHQWADLAFAVIERLGDSGKRLAKLYNNLGYLFMGNPITIRRLFLFSRDWRSAKNSGAGR